jgi:hypothetical protein
MIEIVLKDEHGGMQSFPRTADAILWIQNQIRDWQPVLSAIAESSDDFLLSPIQNWNRVLHGLEDHRKTDNEGDYFLDERFNATISSKSPVYSGFRYVSENLDITGIRGAATSLGWGGRLDWNNNKQANGAYLIERTIRKFQEMRDDDEIRNANSQLDRIKEKINHINNDISINQAALLDISTIFSEKSQAVKSEFDKFEVIVTTKSSLLENEINNLDIKISSLTNVYEDSINKAIQDGSNSIDSWVLAQREQTRIEAPVRLWEDRAKNHIKYSKIMRNSAFFAGVVGLIIAYLVATIMYDLAGNLFESALVEQKNTSGIGTGLKATFHFQLIFSATATLLWLTMFFWMMRVIVKRYVVEIHLATDASGRAAMTQTYLGLIKEGAASDAERAIIMGAIFQPVTSSIANEDGAPTISLPSIMAAIVSGKSPVG